MQRRHFLAASLATVFARVAAAASNRPPRILLRSSWQVVNIGDIAHTPGVLALIEKHIPEAEVILWASGDLNAEVAEMEHRRFPKLKIVKGTIREDGTATNSDLGEALDWCDFLLHGSGPSLVAQKDIAAFVKHVGKPFGVYGITYGGSSRSVRELMSLAEFLYFRDSVSLDVAKREGIKSPVMEFSPDGAFACDLKNDELADRFLKEHGLEPGQFVCCIPRLRYTPYWLIKEGRARDEAKAARNEEMREHDHAPLREAIITIVRETDHRVLLCPEDMTQMQVGKDNVFDQLPADVQQRVVWRDRFWLTDEALSTYRCSAGLFGLEMHSPIMCIGNGIPAIVCRFEEQTSKGFMWRDIGLSDWLFDADDAQKMQDFVPTVLKMVTDAAGAKETAARAQALVAQRHAETMAVVQQSAAAP